MKNISFPSVQQSFISGTQNSVNKTTTPFEAQKSFKSVLKETINKVNDAQLEADTMTEKLVKGENIDLHQLMIAGQKANITLQATLEVRNKVIEAYQEMMRMQV